MIKFFAAGLILSLVGINFAKLPPMPWPDTRHYWAERAINLRLQPCGSEVVLKTSGDVYLTPVGWKNTFSIHLGRPNITIQTNEGKLIDLLQCECQKPLGEYLSRPYLAEFDDEGLLKNIEVDCDEDDLAVNLKRLIANYYHLSIPQLDGKEHSVVSPTNTAVGLCPTTREILKHKNGIQMKGSVDFSNCKIIREDDRSGKATCLGQTCRSTKEKNIKWFGTVDTSVKRLDNGRLVVEKSETNQWGSYNPHKESDEEISWNLNIQTYLLSVKNINVPLFRGGKTVTVNGPRFPKIDEGVCESKKRNGLTDMYGAVVCEQPFSFMYEDIVARAIECY